MIVANYFQCKTKWNRNVGLEMEGHFSCFSKQKLLFIVHDKNISNTYLSSSHKFFNVTPIEMKI